MSTDSTEVYVEKRRKKYDIAYFDLRLIENLAACTLYKQAKGKLKPCRDNIDYIMNYIVRGYNSYDSTRGLELRNYLINKAKFAIKHLLNKKRRKKMKVFSLDNQLGHYEGFSRKNTIASKVKFDEIIQCKEIINFIEESPIFNERERGVLLGYFRDNIPLVEIADQLNIHRTYIYVLYDRGIEKLKRKFYE